MREYEKNKKYPKKGSLRFPSSKKAWRQFDSLKMSTLHFYFHKKKDVAVISVMVLIPSGDCAEFLVTFRNWVFMDGV
jgi:hypothetical protein